MSKKCKITININGVPHVIEDSILDNGTLDEALSSIYNNEEILNIINDNELRRSKNALTGFNEYSSDQEIVRLGVQGNHSFKSLIMEYHRDNDIFDWIHLFENLGINISDNNILVKEKKDSSENTVISTPLRSFYIIDESFIESPEFIINKLVSLYLDKKKDLSNFDSVLSEIKREKSLSEILPKGTLNNSRDFIKYIYSSYSVKNMLIQADLFDPINEVLVGEINNNTNQINSALTDISKKVSYNNIVLEQSDNKRETLSRLMRRTYTGNVTKLLPNQIFVFGSNTQGRHGYGSAKDALNLFGAIYGQSRGPQGKSYAIITKDLTKPRELQKRSIAPSEIENQIKDLYDYAKDNPDKDFLVAYKKDGTNNNGYTSKEMASMFAKHDIPLNIVFEQGFNELITNINYKPNDLNIITFDNGTELATPFKLNDQQESALKNIAQYLKSDKKESVLVGYAGTGKTSIMTLVNEYFKKTNINPFSEANIIFSSPTNRANAVLRQKLSRGTTIKTLHSLFGFSPDLKLENGDYDLKDLEFSSKMLDKNGVPRQLNKETVLVIDESSMIPKALHDFIKKTQDQIGYKVLYIGDPKQLKPVKNTKISPVFDISDKSELTKVERTGDNPILFESTNLREGGDLTYQSRLVEGKGVLYYNSNSELNSVIKQHLTSDEFKSDKLSFRMLTATNDEAKKLNEYSQKLIYGDNRQLHQGELLMAYDNFGVDYRTKIPIINNSNDYEVIKIAPGENRSGVFDPETKEEVKIDGYHVALKDLLDTTRPVIEIFIASKTNDKSKIYKYLKEISKLNIEGANYMSQKKIRDAATKFQAARDLKERIAFQEDILDENGKIKAKKTFDLGYAHTIHKSQGGTYKNVVFMENGTNIFKSDKEVVQQLKYVAVSRASDKVYVYTNHALKNSDLSAINFSNFSIRKYSNKGFTNHSGGAEGSDIAWDNIGKKYGFNNNNHYYIGEKSVSNAPHGNKEVSSQDAKEGASKVAKAAKANFGYQYGTMKDPRLIRNWSQVKYADAIYAIGTLVKPGERLFPDQADDTRLALQAAVTGGTGYAVEMAIQAGKPVYVFDQSRNQWFKNINGEWSVSETPTLSKNFAGIGTRNITESGKQAIEDVYKKTKENDVYSENMYSIEYNGSVYDFETQARNISELMKEIYPNESDERINKAIDYLKSGNNEFIENLINKLTNCK